MGTEELLAQYQMILNNMEDPVFIMDRNGKTLAANVATYKIYGCTKKQFEQMYSRTSWLLEHGIIDVCDYVAVTKTKRPTEEILHLKKKDGETKDYYVKKVPVFDPMGNVKYIVGWMKEKRIIDECYQMLNGVEEKTQQSSLLQADAGGKNAVIYQSREMEKLLKMLGNVAKTDASVLLLGETGTGKEVLAKYTHSMSRRNGREMIVVNCAAVSPALFETEMFGYTKGSFTGADPGGRKGMIEAADQSTLFLDEINSLPLELQGKLLRVLEQKEVRRVGSNKPLPVDFRLLAATNVDLEQLVAEGKFRSDLYYRINTVSVTVPPLRDRQDDIAPLAAYFLEYYCDRYGMKKSFSADVFRQMRMYAWPGNVRELKHLVERAILTSDVDAVELKTLAFSNVEFQRRAAGRTPGASAGDFGDGRMPANGVICN